MTPKSNSTKYIRMRELQRKARQAQTGKVKTRREDDDRGIYANSHTTKKPEDALISPNRLIPKHIWEGIEQAYQTKKLPNIISMGKKMLQFPDQQESSEESTDKSYIERQISVAENIRKRNIEEIIGEAAASIAMNTEANVIVSVEKSQHTDDKGLFVKVSVFRKREDKEFDRIEYHTKLRRATPGSVLPLRDLLSEAIARKYIQKHDRIVCVEDESVSMGFKGMLFIFDVDDLFFNISTAQLPEMVNSEILEAVIAVAQEISHEGREGKHIGTSFIIGDKEEVLMYTRQIILNPFRNYPEEERKIMDPGLRETIKSFAQLDGAFVIDEKGSVVTAGAMISNSIPGVEPVNMPGFGTRHNSAATLTRAIPNAVAVVVSSSGGAVRIFKEGKMLMRVS
ncbi:MAG: DNA integrity scanning protein DisA nucleotide-binding domain protein [Candidatus Woesearchaeota archaeon]